MEDWEYVDYIKTVSDTRLLLNPRWIEPFVDDDIDILDTILDMDLEFPDEMILNNLEESPIVVDVDDDGRIVFIYAATKSLLEYILELYPHLEPVSTYDPNYMYIRLEDFDNLLELRDSYTSI